MFTLVRRMIRSLNMQETGRRSATRMRATVASGTEAVANPAQPAPQHLLSLLATVAHELRGPLTALATSSELLAEDFVRLDPSQIKDMLGAMHRRTLWLQGLVENLLCAATIREGRLQLLDRKSTRLNSSHLVISYAVFGLKKKTLFAYWLLPFKH